MTALPLALALALAAVGQPARNARPTASSATSAAPEKLSDAEVARRVNTLLGNIDRPVRSAQWQALGPAAAKPLAAIARDPKALPSRRAKAVSALAVIGGPEAEKAAVEVAQAESTPFAVRTSAVRSAATLLQPADAARQLRPVLEEAKNPTVRAVAADALAQHAPEEACAAVRAQAGREARSARTQFRSALTRCQAALSQ